MTKIKALLLGGGVNIIIFAIYFYEIKYEIGLITLSLYYIIPSIFFKGFNFQKATTHVTFSDKLKIIGSLIGLFLLNITFPLFFYSLLDIGELNPPSTLGDLKFIEIVSILLIYPFLEEIFFRKVIAKGLYNKYGYNTAIWLSGFLFAISHSFVDTGFLISLLAGLIFATIYLRTNKIGYTILGHILINLLILYLSKKITFTILKIEFIILLIIISLFLIGLMFFKKEKNEKKKRIKT